MRCLILLTWVALWLGSPNKTRAQDARADNRSPSPAQLTLEDQFERTHDLADHAGDIVVLLYGDRQGMPANKELGEKLYVHYHPAAKGQASPQAAKASVAPLPDLPEGKRSPDVKVVPVACFSKAGNVFKNVIRNQVKKNAPETPVWLDFEEKTKEQFGLTPGVPNLALIDAQGRVRHRSAGELDAKGYSRLLEAIDFLRKEAVGTNR
jgi:hypothetical protein